MNHSSGRICVILLLLAAIVSLEQLEWISNSSIVWNIFSLDVFTSKDKQNIKQSKRQDYAPHCNNDDQNSYNYEAPEPFPYLHDCCDDCNPGVPESPDPLVSMTWDFDYNYQNNDYTGTPLQIYRSFDPVALYTIPPDASILLSDDRNSKPRLLILEDCTVVMDWGSERAAWFELQSTDDLTKAKVTASLSEYNKPYPGKERPLTKYGESTYRLETNDELYEGIRFTFLKVEFPATATATGANQSSNIIAIDDFSIVSKIKPISYTGSFSSSNPILTKAWYWGAYGVRLNVERTQLNSILIERGDRVAIQGDAHPTIATMLAVFYSHETKLLLQNELNETDNAHKHVVDDGIMPYPLYWCLSAMDYYWTTVPGENDHDDNVFVRQLVDDIAILLDKRIDDFLDPNLDITWFGWDDRVGNGWCFHSNNDVCTREALLAFWGLVIHVCNEFVRVLESLQNTDMAETYRNHSINMTQALRQVPEFPSQFGVHAAANAINAKIATPQEISEHWMGTTDTTNTLNNAVTICSFSQFNQYWILQAFGNMKDGLEHGLQSVELCWGPMMALSTGGCFWEMSSPEWLRFMKEGDQAPHLPSYCHPWASGVTPWLSKLVGGVSPLQRGYERFVAMPFVSKDYPSVNATTPTPFGPIVVSAQLTKQDSALRSSSNTGFEFEATIDSNATGFFGVQKSMGTTGDPNEWTIATVCVNGIPVQALKFLEANHIADLFPGSNTSARSEHYVFVAIPTGRHRVTASYEGLKQVGRGDVLDARTNPFPPAKYPATVSIDRKLQGDGLLVYGSDGYSLRGCDAKLAKDPLPEYVQNLTIIQHGFPGWVVPDESLVGYSDTNPVYLPVSQDSNAKRVLGSVGIDDQGGGDINCVLVNVQLEPPKAPQHYSLSIYFVASHPGNQHAIRVMDGETYNVIAPTALIEDYEGGVWWTLHTDRPSIRLKMMDIEGIHISAVAFATHLSNMANKGQIQ